MKIMLLEDDPVISSALARDLAREGHTVTQCATMAAGWKAYREGGYGLLILDVNLPDGKSF